VPGRHDSKLSLAKTRLVRRKPQGYLGPGRTVYTDNDHARQCRT
jgi:hypothetical protein